MNHHKTIILFGILTAAMPFLGFPGSWKRIIFVLLGVGVVFFTYRNGIAAQDTTANTKEKDENNVTKTHHDEYREYQSESEEENTPDVVGQNDEEKE